MNKNFQTILRPYATDFLYTDEARLIRVMWELIEPHAKFDRLNVSRTVVFFGSARLLPRDVSIAKLDKIKTEIAENGSTTELEDRLKFAENQLVMSNYYEDAVEVARLLAEWSETLPTADQFFVCSGGAGGIMEAANRGASLVGCKSIGLNIDLPFEQNSNRFVSPELDLEFHYFFMRKFWFVNLAEALLIFPGGFGTLDELMELLTLVQTGKTEKPIPIIVYGTEYWNEVINFEAMVKWGTISASDLSLFKFIDTPADAFEYLKSRIRRRGNFS